MRSVRLCLTFTLVFLLATLLNAVLTRNKLPQEPHKFTIEKNVQMEFLLGNDTAYLQLHKGDSV